MYRLVLLSYRALLLVNGLVLALNGGLQLCICRRKVVDTLIELCYVGVLVVELFLQVGNLRVFLIKLRLVIADELLYALAVSRIVACHLCLKLVDAGTLLAKQLSKALKLRAHLRLIQFALTVAELLDKTFLSGDAVETNRHHVNEVGHLLDILLVKAI